MSKRTCSIDGCEKAHKGHGYCPMHLSRYKIHGDPLKGSMPIRKTVACSVYGCETTSIANGFCQKHYNRVRANGSPYDADQCFVIQEFSACLFCGGPIPAGGPLRRYCRRACASSFSQGAKRPADRPCAKCGDLIDFSTRTPSGRLRPSMTLLCRACVPPAHLRKHIPELLARDGGDCSLCSQAIDLSLKFPHPKSRSIDHVIPRSLGGPDDIGNYRLAHLGCNSAKRNRVDVAA